jgi:thioesterase domain-containing protein
MDPRRLQQYLHEHIPLSRAMGVEVVAATSDVVVLSAPLAPNINHRETVFGGSASAVALLAAWGLLYVRLQQDGIDSRVVVQRNSMSYEQPITADFTATAAMGNGSTWQSFTRMLGRKGRARIAVTVRLDCQGSKVGELVGDFVALSQ